MGEKIRRLPSEILPIKGLKEFRHRSRSCVYFLIKDSVVVYVGMTRHLPARIVSHHQYGKKFDRVAYLECAESNKATIERALIRHLRPQLNGTRIGSLCPADEKMLEIIGIKNFTTARF